MSAPYMTEAPEVAATARDPLAFLPGVAEHLGHYVYALVDPRDDAIFYVGKGQGDRVYQHARHARKVADDESRATLKLDRIQSIHGDGLEVRVEIVRHGLSEELAFEVEAAVIDVLKLSGLDLANAVAGQGTEHGWRPLEEIVLEYAADPVEILDEHRVLLIRIRREFRYDMTAEELYDKTRRWWVVNPRRRPDYAFAVYDGIVRAVYRIDQESWLQASDNPRRWGFDAERDPAMEDLYVWRSVASCMPVGAQNPIRYIHC